MPKPKPRVVYLNGKFVQEQDAKLSIYDLSVMQSAAAFEMTRSFRGLHFKLPQHIQRLVDSCQALGIEYRFEDLEAICHEVTNKNDHGPGEEHRLLIVVSPGCAEIYKELKGVITKPFVYVADFPLRYTVKGFGKYFDEGVHAISSEIRQIPDACVPSWTKHRSRLHFHLAQMRAPKGCWPILRNLQGEYVEAPGANLVYVKNGKVVCQHRNALPGISMQTIHELVPEAEDGGWFGKELPDELWLTGTPFCMLPVVTLDGRPIGDGKPGPVYRQTLEKWNQLVGLDIAAQIKGWETL